MTSHLSNLYKLKYVSYLQKDLKYLDALANIRKEEPNLPWSAVMSRVSLLPILSSYHPESKEKFVNEYENTVK